MSSIGKAIGKVVGGITGSSDQAEAASDAAGIQAKTAQLGIEEQRRQFDKLIELMRPYVQTGQSALQAQSDLLGLQGGSKQVDAIQRLQKSSQFQELMKQAEQGILQNASATGGLRGGNVQAALGQFRPEMLQALIQQRLGNLGGLAQLGQASAAGQASGGLQTGANISSLLQQQGAAQAGGALAQGSVTRQGFSDILGLAGIATGLKGLF